MQSNLKLQAIGAAASLVLVLGGIGLNSTPGVLAQSAPAAPALGAPRVGELWGRTELYFGSGKPDGSFVKESEFRAFVDREITPRFPDGLTLLNGYGQYRGAGGKIAKEQSFVLVLLYPKLDKDVNARLEAVRTAYKRAFRQESVLRVDGSARVSF